MNQFIDTLSSHKEFSALFKACALSLVTASIAFVGHITSWITDKAIWIAFICHGLIDLHNVSRLGVSNSEETDDQDEKSEDEDGFHD